MIYNSKNKNTKQSTFLNKPHEHIKAFVIVCNVEGPIQEEVFR